MAKYGIPYQGSKSGIADSIITVLPKGKRFCDLFGGGFAMTECAIKSGKYDSFLYNEINPLVPALIKKAINGEYAYDRFKPEFISREKYNELKDKDGYIAYIWSFGNNSECGYMFAKDLEPMKKSLHNFIVFGIKDEFISQKFNDIDKYIKPEQKDIRARRLLLNRYMNIKKQRFANSLNALNICNSLNSLNICNSLNALNICNSLNALNICNSLNSLNICNSLNSLKLNAGVISTTNIKTVMWYIATRRMKIPQHIKASLISSSSMNGRQQEIIPCISVHIR